MNEDFSFCFNLRRVFEEFMDDVCKNLWMMFVKSKKEEGLWVKDFMAFNLSLLGK